MTTQKKRPFRAPRGTVARAADGSWRYELDDVADLDRKLGRPLLEAVLGAMVLADRLAALAHFLYLCKPFPRDSAIWQRNVGTAMFLAAGLLRELSVATKRLRRELRVRGWYEKNDPQMIRLREFESAWDADRRLIDARDHAAFHVDTATLSAGLNAIVKVGKPLFPLQGDGPKVYETYSPLAQEAIFHGLGIDHEERRHFMDATEHHFAVAPLLKDIFSGLLLKADIPLTETTWAR